MDVASILAGLYKEWALQSAKMAELIWIFLDILYSLVDRHLVQALKNFSKYHFIQFSIVK